MHRINCDKRPKLITAIEAEAFVLLISKRLYTKPALYCVVAFIVKTASPLCLLVKTQHFLINQKTNSVQTLPAINYAE